MLSFKDTETISIFQTSPSSCLISAPQKAPGKIWPQPPVSPVILASVTHCGALGCFDMQISHRIHNQHRLQLTARRVSYAQGLLRHKAGTPRLHRLHVRRRRSRLSFLGAGGATRRAPRVPSVQNLALSARMETGGGGLQAGGHTWVGMGRVAEEPPAGRCGAPRDLRQSRSSGLKESVISSGQKAGPRHCQLPDFYHKSHTTWDFLKVLVPRTKQFHEDFFFFKCKNVSKTPKQVPSLFYC